MSKINEEKTVKAYKGFDSELKCRDFQYEVGKEYEMEGEIDCCHRGFHACESPLEVLRYYFLDKYAGFRRFCEVEQSGKMDKEDNGSTKIASSKIKIKAELKFTDLIKLGVEWIQEKTRNSKDKNDNGGYSARIGSSGDSAQIGSSGDSAQIGSSGDYARIGSSGDSARINATGEDSVICCAGIDAKARAKKGSWITLSEWKYNKEKDIYVPVCVKTEQVDGERIKEDTWYQLKDGEFVECSID